MGAAAGAILRVWLEVGHGASNLRPGKFDPGTIACGASEHEVSYRIADLVLDRFWHDDESEVEVVEVPSCTTHCLKKHPGQSHLRYKIEHINKNLKRGSNGRPIREVLVSLHMNSGPASATGTEVLYSPTAPAERKRIAADVSRAVAASLGQVNRGAKTDVEARGPGKTVALIRRVDCPAYLIELGFVSNPEDVLRVRECGADAVIAAIGVIAKEHQ